MGVYEWVIEKYGRDHQLRKTIEELDELKAEILKVLGAEGDINNLISEMADVCNMIRQLQLMFNISNHKLDFEMGRKMGIVLKKQSDECAKCIYETRNDCNICDFKVGK